MSDPDGHLSSAAIQQYRERRLSPAELMALDRHAAACARCRGRLALHGDAGAAAAALRPPVEREPHLTYEERAGIADGTISVREMARLEPHVRQCAGCAEEVETLRDLRAELEAEEHPLGWEARPALRPRRALRGPALALGLAGAAALFVVQQARFEGSLSEQGRRLADMAGRQARLASENRRLEELQVGLERERARLAAEAGRVPELERRAGDLARQYQEERRRRVASEPRSAAGPAAGRPLVDGSALIVTVDGRPRRVSAGEPLPPAAADALAGRQLALAPELAELAGPAPRVRGRGFRLTAPVQTRVRETRPLFRWESVPAAGAYRVRVRGPGVDRTSPDLARAEWRWPEREDGLEVPPLRRGETYSWEVTAFQGGRAVGYAPVDPDPAARFQVMPAPALAALEKELARHRDSPLFQGVLLARAGLLDEAAARFERFTAANPGSPAARRLLEQVRERSRAGSAAPPSGEGPPPGD